MLTFYSFPLLLDESNGKVLVQRWNCRKLLDLPGGPILLALLPSWRCSPAAKAIKAINITTANKVTINNTMDTTAATEVILHPHPRNQKITTTQSFPSLAPPQTRTSSPPSKCSILMGTV